MDPLTMGGEVGAMSLEDGGRGYEPRNAGWNKQGNRFSP
jgi:hypothetical protein